MYVYISWRFITHQGIDYTRYWQLNLLKFNRKFFCKTGGSLKHTYVPHLSKSTSLNSLHALRLFRNNWLNFNINSHLPGLSWATEYEQTICSSAIQLNIIIVSTTASIKWTFALRPDVQNALSLCQVFNNCGNVHLVNSVVKHPVGSNEWGEARGRWLVSYRDWFSFSDCCFCWYIGRNVVEAVTDGDLIESIYHHCPGGRNVSFMGYNLDVSRCYLVVLAE